MRENAAKVVDVFGGAFAAFLFELNEDFGIRTADGASIAVAEVNAAIGKTDVVQNRGELLLGNHLANAQAGASAHVQTNLSGIHFWKKVAAEHQDQRQGKQAKAQEHNDKCGGRLERRLQGVAISFAESLKAALKFLLIAAKKALFFANMFFGLIFVLGAQQVHGQRGHDRSGPHIRREHGENDSFRERNEKIFGDAGQEEHGNEDDADA